MFVTGFGLYSYPDNDLYSTCTGEAEISPAVFDRIEDGEQAVILIEELQKEWIVPIDKLPRGSRVNMWFDVLENEEKPEVIRINHGTTKKALEKVRGGPGK